MNLKIVHRELSIDLSERERIIMHLAQPLPFPSTPYDVEALPRTAHHMAALLKIPYPTLSRTLKKMVEDEGVMAVHAMGLRTHATKQCKVYKLTADGELLAEAIRRRTV